MHPNIGRTCLEPEEGFEPLTPEAVTLSHSGTKNFGCLLHFFHHREFTNSHLIYLGVFEATPHPLGLVKYYQQALHCLFLPNMKAT